VIHKITPLNDEQVHDAIAAEILVLSHRCEAVVAPNSFKARSLCADPHPQTAAVGGHTVSPT